LLLVLVNCIMGLSHRHKHNDGINKKSYLKKRLKENISRTYSLLKKLQIEAKE